MDKEAWDELYGWLKQGKKYLQERVADTASRDNEYTKIEYVRLKGKLEGIKLCMEHMEETERLYHFRETGE